MSAVLATVLKPLRGYCEECEDTWDIRPGSLFSDDYRCPECGRECDAILEGHA